MVVKNHSWSKTDTLIFLTDWMNEKVHSLGLSEKEVSRLYAGDIEGTEVRRS